MCYEHETRPRLQRENRDVGTRLVKRGEKRYNYLRLKSGTRTEPGTYLCTSCFKISLNSVSYVGYDRNFMSHYKLSEKKKSLKMFPVMIIYALNIKKC